MSGEYEVDDKGNCQIQQTYEYVNAWAPHFAINLRCNNDIKFLMNGSDTRNLTFYASMYQTKKQGKNYNMSAVMTKGYEYHTNQLGRSGTQIHDLRNNQRLLIFQIVHTMNREQELAGPMVVAYLMGWGDVIHSHHYSNVYWSTFTRTLLSAFPELRTRTSENERVTQPSVGESNQASSANKASSFNSNLLLTIPTLMHFVIKEEEPTVSLQLDNGEHVRAWNQVTDYEYRGTEQDEVNIIHFFKDNYDEAIRCSPPDKSNTHTGCPRHNRVQYTPDHPYHTSRQRVLCPELHNNLINFVGPWFPRRNDADGEDVYYASMVMLFRPWCNIRSDLKGTDKTWKQAFEHLQAGMSCEELRMLDNIQYYYHCKQSADKHSEDDAEENETLSTEHTNQEDYEYVEEDEEQTCETRRVDREMINGQLAIEAGRLIGIFSEEAEEPTADTLSGAWHTFRNAIAVDFENLQNWRSHLDASSPDGLSVHDIHHANGDARVEQLLEVQVNHSDATVPEGCETSLDMINVDFLNGDQLRAFDIITWHIERTLSGLQPPPLHLMIHGEGGTGKSALIQTVSEYFSK